MSTTLSWNVTFTKAGLIQYKPLTYLINTGLLLSFSSKNIKGATIFELRESKLN